MFGANRKAELLVAVWGAITFGAILASYFAFRAVRDAIVVGGNPDNIQWLFTATFIAVSIVSPLWSALLSRGGRRRYVPLAFHAFTVCLLVFAGLVASDIAPVSVGRVFYVWSAVFNLFIVSVFWSLLADLLGPSVARRLYGPIAAGGTLGAIVGPLLTRELVDTIGIDGILVMSAVLLQLGALGVHQVRRAGEALERGPDEPLAPDDTPPEPALPAAVRGLRELARSPYLLAIVGYVLCTATAATFVYLEQISITKAALATNEARTEWFANVDLWTNTSAFLLQTLIAAQLLRWLGPGLVLVALPLVQGAGVAVLATTKSLAALGLVLVATRAVTHGLTRPARELLFTVVSRDDKYRAKNVIDTIVYRAGDMGSSWLRRGLVAAGAGSFALVAAMIPIVTLWVALAAILGVGYRRRLPATPPVAAPPRSSITEEPA